MGRVSGEKHLQTSFITKPCVIGQCKPQSLRRVPSRPGPAIDQVTSADRHREWPGRHSCADVDSSRSCDPCSFLGYRMQLNRFGVRRQGTISPEQPPTPKCILVKSVSFLSHLDGVVLGWEGCLLTLPPLALSASLCLLGHERAAERYSTVQCAVCSS